MKKILVRPDRTLADRTRGKALSFLFTHALARLAKAPNWPQGWRLATHGAKGLLYARNDTLQDHVELFVMSQSEASGAYNIEVVPGGYAAFGMQDKDAEAAAKAAMQDLQQLFAK